MAQDKVTLFSRNNFFPLENDASCVAPRATGRDRCIVLCRIERSPRAAKSAGGVSTSALDRCMILTGDIQTD